MSILRKADCWKATRTLQMQFLRFAIDHSLKQIDFLPSTVALSLCSPKLFHCCHFVGEWSVQIMGKRNLVLERKFSSPESMFTLEAFSFITTRLNYLQEQEYYISIRMVKISLVLMNQTFKINDQFHLLQLITHLEICLKANYYRYYQVQYILFAVPKPTVFFEGTHNRGLIFPDHPRRIISFF